MQDARPPRVLDERRGRWLLNLYPPLWFNRVRIVQIGLGFRSCRVRVARSVWTRNLHGTTFGGTIFSAADPFYAVMYWQIFARRGIRVQAWLKRAAIRYRKPATTALTLEFALESAEVDRAAQVLGAVGHYSATYRTAAVDEHHDVCAEIDTEVHLRLPRADQREVSSF